MKTMTAREFSQHASEIGKYLSKNPKDYFFVTNKIDPKKNFICCRLEFLTKEMDSFHADLIKIYLANERFDVERRLQSSKMSRKYWDSDKIKVNAGNEKSLEKVRSILYDNDSVSSINGDNSDPTDMAFSRRRGARLVHQIYD